MANALESGAVIAGRYRLESPIGEGGYGAVWKATQLNVSRPVAIKFLKAFTFDENAERRFQREAKALARLQHPNCLTLLDFGSSDGVFLVTEFLDGERLDDWIAQTPELVEVLDVALQILAALAHAHRERIVHRDLKPANIVLTRTPDGGLLAKVLDFGISSIVGAKRGDITKTGEVFGTPGYMSPEQLRGEPSGPAADLYAFGVILYQMIEGHPPFTGKSGIEIAVKHMTGAPPPLERDVPEGLQAIVDRLLQKDPRDRPASARDVAEAVARLELSPLVPQQGPPGRPGVAAAPVPPPATERILAKPLPTVDIEPAMPPHRLAIAVVAAVCMLGAGVALLWPEPPPAPREPSSTRIASALSTPAASPKRPSGVVEAATVAVDAGTDVGGPPPVGTPGCGTPFDGRGLQTVSVMTSALDRGAATVYVPESYDPDRPQTVVMLFHDALQTPKELFEALGFADDADRDDVVVVLPHHDTIVFPWNSKESQLQAQQDLKVAGQVLCLSRERVFLYGHGAGGYAAEELTCMLPKVAALAVSAHRLSVDDAPCLHPHTPYLFLAPMHDGRDPIKGGVGCLGGEDGRSLEEHEEIYRKIHGCGTQRRVEDRQHRSICYTWDCDVDFIACHLNGGRPLPGQPAHVPCEGRAPRFAYGAKIWGFFQDHLPPTE